MVKFIKWRTEDSDPTQEHTSMVIPVKTYTEMADVVLNIEDKMSMYALQFPTRKKLRSIVVTLCLKYNLEIYPDYEGDEVVTYNWPMDLAIKRGHDTPKFIDTRVASYHPDRQFPGLKQGWLLLVLDGFWEVLNEADT